MSSKQGTITLIISLAVITLVVGIKAMLLILFVFLLFTIPPWLFAFISCWRCDGWDVAIKECGYKEMLKLLFSDDYN